VMRMLLRAASSRSILMSQIPQPTRQGPRTDGRPCLSRTHSVHAQRTVSTVEKKTPRCDPKRALFSTAPLPLSSPRLPLLM
jgi:hypothetical protein